MVFKLRFNSLHNSSLVRNSLTSRKAASGLGASQVFGRPHLRACPRVKQNINCADQPAGSSSKQRGLPKELDGCQWSAATVVENKAVSADGSLRTLVLSVEDKVVYLEGRSMHRKQERPRWADTYTVPGQFVAARLGSDSAGSAEADALGPHLLAIASSPYAVRRDSADLDASIIEVLVDRRSDGHSAALAGMGPGRLLDVSSVVGRGFASLFNGYVGLLSALEEQRDLCLIGAGCRGIGPLRSVLEWTPVQAHATARRVTLLYACASPTAAAFLKDWDSWRDAGIVVKPIYLEEEDGSSNGAAKQAVPKDLQRSGLRAQAELLAALFGGEHGLAGTIGGEPRDAAVLVAGIPGGVAAAVSRELTARGVARERVLFCDYF